MSEKMVYKGWGTTHGGTVEVYPGADGQYRWHVRARNGEIVGQGEGHPDYPRRRICCGASSSSRNLGCVTATATEPIRHIRCTKREIEVLRALIHDGADNDTIARRLRPPVDVETAKSHLSRVMSKVQVPTRTALAVALLRRHVIVMDRAGRLVKF